MTFSSNAVFKPGTVDFSMPFSFGNADAHVDRLEIYAGLAIGTALVVWRGDHGGDPGSYLGDTARITIDGSTVFRGVVAEGPFTAGTGKDELAILLYCDKWRLEEAVVGEYGIGPADVTAGGFNDVGYDLVFNKGNRPNKAPASYDFSTGTGAVYWELADILTLLLANYVDASEITYSAGTITGAAALGVVPSELNLTGMTALQAIDTVVSMAGLSWALDYGSASSEFVLVVPGSGTTRTAVFATPETGAAPTVTEWHGGEIEVQSSVRNAVDRVRVRSANIIQETMHSNKGTNPLLAAVSGYKSAEYVVAFQVQVNQYENHGLGSNLDAGSDPKPWLPHLITRWKADRTGYEVAETDELPALEPVAVPVWVSEDGTEGNAKLAVGGYSIDLQRGLIEVEAEIEVVGAGASARETLSGLDWGTAGIWVTVATVLESPAWYTTSASGYLPTPHPLVLDRKDIAHVRRYNSWLPDLSADPHGISKVQTGLAAVYIDAEPRMTEIGDAALAESSALEVTAVVEFPFLPVVDLGDKLAVSGRPMPQLTGDEVVTAVRYGLDGRYTTQVTASNITATVDPEQFISRADR